MNLHMQLHGPLFWKVNRPLRKIGLNMKKLLLRQYLATTVACDCVSNDLLVPCDFETTISMNNDDAGQALKTSGTEITNENRVQGVRGIRFIPCVFNFIALFPINCFGSGSGPSSDQLYRWKKKVV